ncbi:hypothetical protein [Brachybacterium sp. ACRRE]|uniref:hypothetical protein n=1 Tax=Brachybacterium sp. ACRRE TaxID=2918184 RepID=UPI001EF332DB|nr:hypothetical protein [Brachybacterium sp. ACRRE]MCG7309540.1 hypothetical protein [Brachybacterium sp. ACRRE]
MSAAPKPARPAGGETVLILRIVLWVCAVVALIGIVLAGLGEVWSLATADDLEGANIGAGLVIIAGGLLGVLGLAGCAVALVGRSVVRRRARADRAR